METSIELIKQLHDIHDPPAISLWPPAIGWWIIALLIILITTWYYYKYYFITHKIRRAALKKFKQLQRVYYKNKNQNQLIIELSILIRRIALAKFPQRQVAKLNGNTWLQFLDKTGNTKEFTQGLGQVLSVAPYQKSPQIEIDRLMVVIEKWIRQQ
jgi:hypothetical protein